MVFWFYVKTSLIFRKYGTSTRAKKNNVRDGRVSVVRFLMKVRHLSLLCELQLENESNSKVTHPMWCAHIFWAFMIVFKNLWVFFLASFTSFQQWKLLFGLQHGKLLSKPCRAFWWNSSKVFSKNKPCKKVLIDCRKDSSIVTTWMHSTQAPSHDSLLLSVD